MNESRDRIIELEKENDFLRRENAALVEEVCFLQEKLVEAERQMSGLRVGLHIAQHEAHEPKEAKKKLQQPRRGWKFEPDDDVKQALRELADFNRSGQRRKELKNRDDRQTQQ